MLTLLLASAAASAAPAADFDFPKVLEACEAVYSNASAKRIEREYRVPYLPHPQRLALRERLLREAMTKQGLPAAQFTLVDKACVLYQMGKMDELVNGAPAPAMELKWQYPDGRTVPMDQYVASLPVAPD